MADELFADLVSAVRDRGSLLVRCERAPGMALRYRFYRWRKQHPEYNWLRARVVRDGILFDIWHPPIQHLAQALKEAGVAR